MTKNHTVTLPDDGWDAVAVLLLMQSRILEREGRRDLLAQLWTDIIPTIRAAVSPQVREWIAEAELKTYPLDRAV